MQSNESTVEAFNSINHDLRELSKTKPVCSIYRVHKHLRDVNNNAYEPEIIAIGPYHRGKDNLKVMEEQKLRYLQLLLDSRKHNVETYISAIGELEQKARDCYAEPITLNAAEFVKMLVLDGCFIIELIRKYNRRADPYTCAYDPIFQMIWIMSSLKRDLILFENQIPFFVLCKLFDLIEGPNQHDRLIHYLLSYFSILYHPRTERIPHTSLQRWSLQETKHLLDLVYNNGFCSTDLAIYVASIENESPVHLNRESQFIHSATKLKDANVDFHKKERDYVKFLDCLINSSRDVEILCELGIIDNLLGDNEMVASTINRLGLSVMGPGPRFVYGKMFDRVNIHYKKGWNRSMAMLRRDVFYSPWAYISFVVGVVFLLLTIVQAVCSILQLLHQ